MEENKNEELNNNENVENFGEESVNTEASTIEGKKKSKVLPIIAGILAGIVGICLIGLIMISILSPKNRFFSLVNGAFSDISKETSKFSKSVFGQILALDMNSKLTVDTTMEGKIETEDATIKEWVQNLESFKLTAYENVDFSNDYSDTNADFILNGEKYLSGSLIQNKNIISAKLDNVTDGYITVDNNNLSTLWEKMGYDGPDSLTSQTDLLKELNFSKSDINDLKGALKVFATGFSTAFTDDNFSYGKGTVTYDEGSIECDTMDFSVSAVELNNGLIGGLEKIASKEKYIDAVYKVISTLDKVNGYEPLTREDFGTNFELMLQEIRSLEFSEEDKGFIIRIYYKGNDILKVDILSEDYNTKIFQFTSVNSKDSGYYKFSDGMTVYEDKVTTIDKVITHTINVDYINYETGEIYEGEGSEIKITIDNSVKNEQSINLVEKMRLFSYDEDFENLDIMSIEPTVIRNYTIKGKVDGNLNNIEVTLIDGDNDFTNTFKISAVIKEKADFDYVTVNENENFNASTATDDEITNKKNKVIENWNTTAGSDKTKVQQFESAVSMYLSMFMPAEYYETGDYSDIDWDAIDLEGLEGIE